jgi:XRE family transcriptional regulator, aerobic/anaerobic benzoate catabolism transcriptional regulator
MWMEAPQKPRRADHPLLAQLGARVRSLRAELGLTRRELAAHSGLSERFMADLEAGRANISVLNLAQLAEALRVQPATLIEPRGSSRGVVALLGLRGAGKSTVGRALAHKLGAPFNELDRLVEAEAGMLLPELFAMHGEEYYRRLEIGALQRFLATHPRSVLATGGGVVTSAPAFGLLLERTRTVWLKAQPEEHWARVVSQGDLRPIQNRPQAMNDLRRRLRDREPFYARADVIVSTSGRTVEEVVGELCNVLGGQPAHGQRRRLPDRLQAPPDDKGA